MPAHRGTALPKSVRNTPRIIFCLSTLFDLGIRKFLVTVTAENHPAISKAVRSWQIHDAEVSYLLVEDDSDLSTIVALANEFAAQSRLMTAAGSVLIVGEKMRTQLKRVLQVCSGATAFKLKCADVQQTDSRLDMLVLDASVQRLMMCTDIPTPISTLRQLTSYCRNVAKYSEVDLDLSGVCVDLLCEEPIDFSGPGPR